MNPKEYIISIVNKFKEEFKGIIIEYSYDETCNYYIITVSPENIRRGNTEYKKLEMETLIEFSEKFPNDNLLITKPKNF